MRQPDAKDKLQRGIHCRARAGGSRGLPELAARLVVPDMSMQNGMPIYNKPDAERAWSKLIALYKTALA